MNLLFIGNSYTFFHDLPGIFRTLARDSGIDIQVDSVTRGGWFLHKYLDVENEHSAKLQELVAQNHYDLCVLQEQSLAPAVAYTTFHDGAARLKAYLEPAVDRFVLYATWGRKEGHPALAQHNLTPDSMMEALEKSYCRAGKELGASVAPVGRNFAKIRNALPALDLYDPDLTHPSYAGSCVAALTLYMRIFGVLPKNTQSLQLTQQQIDTMLEVVANQKNL